MATYSISEVAEIMGVSAYTLRFYDKEGLLPFVERVNGRRVFRDKDFPWLKMLACLKNTGMPLREIRRYMELSVEPGDTTKERYELLLAHRRELIKQIEFLNMNLAELDRKCSHLKSSMDGTVESCESCPHPEPGDPGYIEYLTDFFHAMSANWPHGAEKAE